MIRALLFTLAMPTFAQAACAPHDEVTEHLFRLYDEQLLFAAHTKGALVEFYGAIGGSETWTVLVTGEDGKACVLAAGSGFAMVPAKEGDRL